VAIGEGTYPDLRPCGRDRERLDPFQDILFSQLRAVCPHIANACPGLLAAYAGTRIRNIAKTRGRERWHGRKGMDGGVVAVEIRAGARYGPNAYLTTRLRGCRCERRPFAFLVQVVRACATLFQGLRAICALHLICSGYGLPTFCPGMNRKMLNVIGYRAEHFR
jgi:hypothetical protein